MPRGRHRVSPPLHRLLPPLTVAGSATAVAVAAWFGPLGDHAVYPRALAATAAAVACSGAVLLRRWDRAAGRRVTELTIARTRDEWRTEERIAELENDLDDARELCRRLEGELRAKRSELGVLRGDHAHLLRRYATAESARAKALESARRLALQAAPRPAAVGAAGGSAGALVPVSRRPGPTTYLRAAEALRSLADNAARQRAAGTPGAPPPGTPQGGGPGGRHALRPAPAPAEHTGASAAAPAPANGAREHRGMPPGAVPVPSHGIAPRGTDHGARAQGGFDYFGTAKPAASPLAAAPHPAPDRPRPSAPQPLVSQPAAPQPSVPQPSEPQPAAPQPWTAARPEVIDLTAHDDTEPLDVRELRAHSQ